MPHADPRHCDYAPAVRVRLQQLGNYLEMYIYGYLPTRTVNVKRPAYPPNATTADARFGMAGMTGWHLPRYRDDDESQTRLLFVGGRSD